MLLYLGGAFLAVCFIYWGYSEYLKMEKRFEVNEKMEEIKEENVIVNTIRDFESDVDTSSKKSEINNFVN